MTFSEKTIINFRTIQGSVIRNLIESVKEILTDVNITFNNDGIRCTAIDGSETALVYFKLESDKFEYYEVSEETDVGVSMQSLFKLMRTVTNHDTVSMVIFNNDKYVLNIYVENTDKNTVTHSKMKLLDIDKEQYDIPDIKFNNIINMRCIDFQRYCKEMLSISNEIELSCEGDVFKLTCHGDFASQSIEIRECNNKVMDDDQKVTSECFSLKFINLFVKSTSLCQNVEIYLKKEYPLVLVYRIGNLGSIKFCLSPIIKP